MTKKILSPNFKVFWKGTKLREATINQKLNIDYKYISNSQKIN